MCPWHIDTFPLLQHSPTDDSRYYLGEGSFHHFQFQQPVGQQNTLARGDILGQAGMGDGDPLGIAGHLLYGQHKPLAGDQDDRSAPLQGPDAQARPLQVLQNGNGALGLRKASDSIYHRPVLLPGAVGEVEAEHVYPRLH
ncbi:hypothetical protein HRbin23_01448 [bacterium HR23]|nr:hypothetical protein HRbin23_01448 [bacterium HR23]